MTASTTLQPATTSSSGRPPATHPSTTCDTVPTGALGSHSMLLPGRPNLLLAQRRLTSRG